MSIGRFFSISRQSPRRTAAAILATASMGLLACEDTEGSAVRTVSVVDDLGSESGRVALPAAVALGQRAEGRIEMAIEVSVGTGAQSETIEATMAFDVVSEVIDFDDEGGHVNRQYWTNGDVTATSAQFARELAAEVPERFTLEMSLDAAGIVRSVEVVDGDGAMTGAMREAAKQMADDADSNVMFPDEPVGAGARWSTIVTQTTSGTELTLTMDNQLVELTDEVYTVDVSIDDIDERIDGQRLTGTMTGTGSFTGSTSNPLVSTGTSTLSMDMRGGGMSMELTIDIDVDLTEPV